MSISVAKCELSKPERVTRGIYTGRRPGMGCHILCWLRRTSLKMDKAKRGVKVKSKIETEEQRITLKTHGGGLKWDDRF